MPITNHTEMMVSVAIRTVELSRATVVQPWRATVTQGFLYAPFGEITTEFNARFGNGIIPKYTFNAK